MKRTGMLLVVMMFTAGMVFAQNNTADIDQSGNNNSADVDQFGYSNFAEIVQSGNENLAYIDQVGDNNTASQTQNGSFNDAEIAQYGAENQASITQDGENNTAVIEQGAWGGSENSVANFTQTGNGNYFETTMVRSYDNTVTGVQEGDDNYFRAGVRGYDNVVTMDVFGDANRGSWSIGSIGWPHQPADNELTINVIGSDNYSSGVIAGDENVVNILQHGNGNRIGTSWHTADGVNIEGDRNTVSIQQYSDYNSASVTVVGHGNTASIVQD